MRWALVFSVVLAASSGARADAPELDSFHGVWDREFVEVDDLARAEAIRSGLAERAWLVRAVAAPILGSETAPPDELEFVVSSGECRVLRDGVEFLVLVRSEDGWAADSGERTARVEEREIQLRWQHRGAGGTTHYELTADASLEVRTSIQLPGEGLGGQILYRSRFSARTPR